MSENWHEERDRLVKLLKAIESGKISHVDENGFCLIETTNPENIEWIKERIAELNRRLG